MGGIRRDYRMKLGVLSDTHLQTYDKRLERIIAEYFKDVDTILHAGDIVDESVLEVFKEKEIIAVCGNMDSPYLKKSMPTKRVIDVAGRRIGLIHGWGNPEGIEKRVAAEFGDGADCVVFGHTHVPQARVIDGVFFFNPGSLTDRRFTEKNTIGILEIGEKIGGTILPVDFYRED